MNFLLLSMDGNGVTFPYFENPSREWRANGISNYEFSAWERQYQMSGGVLCSRGVPNLSRCPLSLEH